MKCNCIGAFSEVRMCVHKETGAQRAVKVINKSELDEDELKMFLNEVKIVKTMVSSFKF